MDSLETLEPRRSTEEEIRKYREILARADSLEKLLDSFSICVVVLDERRHILYGNKIFRDSFEEDFSLSYAAPRPGEFFGCRYAWASPTGCGDGNQCRYCGAGQALFSPFGKIVRSFRIVSSKFPGAKVFPIWNTGLAWPLSASKDTVSSW